MAVLALKELVTNRWMGINKLVGWFIKTLFKFMQGKEILDEDP